MKKIYLFLMGAAMLTLGSCTATHWTATTADVDNCVYTSTVADLNVGAKASFTYKTTAKDRKGGGKNCLKAAVASMLKANNADVLVAPEFKYNNDLKTIEVTGYPATYKNFRPSTAPVPVFPPHKK